MNNLMTGITMAMLLAPTMAMAINQDTITHSTCQIISARGGLTVGPSLQKKGYKLAQFIVKDRKGESHVIVPRSADPVNERYKDMAESNYAVQLASLHIDLALTFKLYRADGSEVPSKNADLNSHAFSMEGDEYQITANEPVVVKAFINVKVAEPDAKKKGLRVVLKPVYTKNIFTSEVTSARKLFEEYLREVTAPEGKEALARLEAELADPKEQAEINEHALEPWLLNSVMSYKVGMQHLNEQDFFSIYLPQCVSK